MQTDATTFFCQVKIGHMELEVLMKQTQVITVIKGIFHSDD